MINIHFSGVDYDPVSPIIFELDLGQSRLGSKTRRISKAQALDATTAFQDFGETIADQEPVYALHNPKPQQIEDLEYIMDMQGCARVAYPNVCLKVRLLRMNLIATTLKVSCFVERDLTV